jgi:hypothetical protein
MPTGCEGQREEGEEEQDILPSETRRHCRYAIAGPLEVEMVL